MPLFEWVQGIGLLYHFFEDDHSSVLLFFQIPFFPLRLYLSFSLLKASVWFLRCSPALSLCPVLSRWPAAVLLYFIPLSSAPLLLERV